MKTQWRAVFDRPTAPVKTAADLLGLSTFAVYRLAKTGELPSIKLGRRVLIKTEGLHRLLAPEETGGASAPL